MVSITDIVSVIILFNSGMTLFLGIEQLTGRVRYTRHNIVLFIICICAAIIQTNAVFIAQGIPYYYPWFSYLYFTSMYLVGPMTFLYYHLLMRPGIRIKKKRIIHLLPMFVIFLLENILHSLPEDIKERALYTVFYTGDSSMLFVIMIVGGGLFIHYQVITLLEGLPLWNDRRVKKGVRLIIMLEIVNILTIFPALLWIITRRGFFMLISGVMTTFVMTMVFLTHNRFPQIFSIMKHELIRRKYERSFLKGMNRAVLRERLLSLMEEEKIFMDCELTLNLLSDKMSLTPHQLSQFLNEQMKTNFNSFVNKYRIDEAKRLLLEEGSLNILSICYVVGFNSKSSFNTIFKNITGVTPSEFRDRMKN